MAKALNLEISSNIKMKIEPYKQKRIKIAYKFYKKILLKIVRFTKKSYICRNRIFLHKYNANKYGSIVIYKKTIHYETQTFISIDDRVILYDSNILR